MIISSCNNEYVESVTWADILHTGLQAQLWLANFNRSAFTPPEKHAELQTLPCVDIDDMVDSAQVRWVLMCFTNYLFKVMLALQSIVWSHSRSCVSQFVRIFIGKAHAKRILQENIQEDDAMYVQYRTMIFNTQLIIPVISLYSSQSGYLGI